MGDAVAQNWVQIHYHVWWPSPGNDPFYLANPSLNSTRNNFYDNNYTPHMFTGGQDSGYNPSIWAGHAVNGVGTYTPVTLELSGELVGNIIQVTVQVTSETNLGSSPLRLIVAATLDSVIYPAPNNLLNHECTLVDFLTPQAGESITLNGTDPVVHNFLWEMNATWPDNPNVIWDIANLNVVAFVQNTATLEVLQAEESRAAELTSEMRVSAVSVPENTESVGPFQLEFTIEDLTGNWSGTKQFHYTCNAVEDSLTMVNTSGITWQADLPAFSSVTGTTALYYWISVDGTAGEQYLWPPGAPLNTMLMIFGPDTAAPQVTGLTQATATHYLLAFEKEVEIAAVWDDRFGIQAPILHWQIGQDPAMNQTMTFVDSVYEDWIWKTRWQGQITGQAGALGDTVSYWVTATDLSQNQNLGSSPVLTFSAGLAEVIGDWEHAPDYSRIPRWKPFTHGVYQPFDYGEFHWNRVITEHMTETYGTGDTMLYERPLDFTNFTQVWLLIPMYYNFRNTDNQGYLEVSANGTSWDVLATLTGTGNPGVRNFDLSGYSGESDVRIRLRVSRTNNILEWLIDDIILHSDPDLLELDEFPVLTGTPFLVRQFPNPFNPVTTIQYQTTSMAPVKIVLYDLAGRKVKTLLDRVSPAGTHTITWNARNDNGLAVAAGIYFYRIQAGSFCKTGKMVLLK